MRKLLCGVVTAMLSACAMAADGLVLAVPVRQMVLNFGFDVMEMAPDKVDFVCYGARSGDDDVAAMEVNLFDPLEGRWGVLDREAWSVGEGLRSGTKSLVVVGSGAMAEAIQRVDWTRDICVFKGERLDDLANAVGAELAFTPSQWRSIARKYGFSIEDHNAELRRIGRRRMRARLEKAEAPAAIPSYPLATMGEIPTIDAPVAERRTPVVVMPLAEIQATQENDAPVPEVSAVEVPAEEAPADVETPAAEASAVEVPAVEEAPVPASAEDAPVPEVPTAEASVAVETPAAEVPAVEATVPVLAPEEVPAMEVPSVEDVPVAEAVEAPEQDPAVPMIVIRPVDAAAE